MLGINSNLNSLVAQQNLNTSQSALSQAITRLSSGKRINSAADDAAGLAISNRMQTQINGLNQGVSNANDGVSMIQTASSGLAQITSSLQTIRTLAVQASSGSLSSSDQAALQQEVAQQIAEVNRVASQTTYNGKNVLDGSAGNVSFQIGANVGQTIGLDLTHSVSAANLGKGVVSAGSVLGSMTGLNLTNQGLANTGTGAAALTSINVLSDGKGGFTFTDQNNQALSTSAVTNLFGGAAANTGTGTPLTLAPQGALVSGASATQTSAIAAAQAANAQITPGAFTANGKVLSTLTLTGGGLSTDLSGQSAGGAIAKIQVSADGNGGYTFQALNSGGTDVTSSINTGSATGSAALASLFATTTGSGSNPGTIALTTAGKNAIGATDTATATTATTGTFAKASAANYVAPTYPTGFAASGTVMGTVATPGKLKADLTGEGGTTPATDITSIQVLADGSGNFTYKALNAAGTDVTSSVTGAGGLTGSAALASLFTTTAATGSSATAGTITGLSGAGTTAFSVGGDATAAATSLSGITTKNQTLKPIGTVSVNLDATGAAANPGTTPAYTSVNVYANGSGGYTFKAVDATGAESTSTTVNAAATALFSVGSSPVGASGDTLTGTGALTANTNGAGVAAGVASVTANNTPGTVASVDISTAAGANSAIESIDNALATVNNIQATLGAAQNRFTSLSSAQQSQSTDLAGAQSQITDANFAQETANLSKAQVLQQAGISVLAQANSLPQQVLKLLQ